MKFVQHAFQYYNVTSAVKTKDMELYNVIIDEHKN